MYCFILYRSMPPVGLFTVVYIHYGFLPAWSLDFSDDRCLSNLWVTHIVINYCVLKSRWNFMAFFIDFFKLYSQNATSLTLVNIVFLVFSVGFLMDGFVSRLFFFFIKSVYYGCKKFCDLRDASSQHWLLSVKYMNKNWMCLSHISNE